MPYVNFVMKGSKMSTEIETSMTETTFSATPPANPTYNHSNC